MKAASREKAEAKPAAPSPAQSQLHFWLAGLLLVLVVVAFAPVLRGGFIDYDDPGYTTANAHVQQGISPDSVGWAFTTTEQYNWHPITWVSHMLDCQIFGLRPWGHHLTSLLLHTANVVLLFLLLLQLTGAMWRSFFVAALFGLHPLRVESVAWIAERKDLLSGLFFILTIWMHALYLKHSKVSGIGSSKTRGATLGSLLHPARLRDDPEIRYRLLSLVFYALGLMSKPMIVTLPFVLLLLDFWPLRRIGPSMGKTPFPVLWRLLGEKLPFFFLSAISCVITVIAQRRGGAMASLLHWPLLFRVENALVSYTRYFGKMFFPEKLAVFYPTPGQWPMMAVGLGLALLAVVTVVVVLRAAKAPYLSVGWLWFIGMLVPVIGLVQVGAQAMANRYTYLPAVGLTIAVVWELSELSQYRKALAVPIQLFGALAVVAVAGLTWKQSLYWKNSESLARHALAVTDKNYVAHNILGLGLCRKERLDEGIVQFRQAISLKPDDPDAYGFLGSTLLLQGKYEECVSVVRQGLVLDRFLPNAHRNLGLAYERMGKVNEAIVELQTHLQLQPGDPETRNELGVVLLQAGRVNDAIVELRRALALKPGLADGHNNLGIALCRIGRIDDGIREFFDFIRLKPNSPDGHNNLGIALARRGRRSEAIVQFQQALKLDPNLPEAQKQLRALTGQVPQ